MIFGGGVLVAGAIPVQRRQRLAGRLRFRIQGDDLFERLDGGGRVARTHELAVALPQLRAAASGDRLVPRRRQRGQHPAQSVRQRESLGQPIRQTAQRDQRRLVLRIFGERLLEQGRRIGDLPALGHQQRRFAPALAALLRILDEVDEQRGGPAAAFGVAGGPLQLEHLFEQGDLSSARPL